MQFVDMEIGLTIVVNQANPWKCSTKKFRANYQWLADVCEVEMIVTQHEVTAYQLTRQFHETRTSVIQIILKRWNNFAFFEIWNK